MTEVPVLATYTGMLVDTQIISYAAKGRLYIDGPVAISSVTAQELLLMQRDMTSNNYYLPRLRTPYRTLGLREWVRLHSANRSDRLVRLMKSRSDRFAFSFAQDFPGTVEYCHDSLSRALNSGPEWEPFISMHFAALPKAARPGVASRLRWLLDNGVQCVPLTIAQSDTFFDLLWTFTRRHQLKANPRNSYNDLLTLALAFDTGRELATDDVLLADLALESAGLKRQINHNISSLSRPRSDDDPRVRPLRTDSKGYINRGWAATRWR